MNFQYISYGEQPIALRTSLCKGKGDLVSPHYHDAMELILVEEGSLCAFINGRTLVGKCGDILLVPCHSVHRASSDDTHTVIKSLFFHPSLVCRENPDISPDRLLNRELAFPYLLDGDSYPHLSHIFLDIYRLSNEKQFRTADVMQIIAGLYVLLGEYVRLVQNDRDTVQSFNRLSPAIDYIRENLHRRIRLKELSGLVYVCDDHLIRLFKRVTHKTPAQYIMDARIERAMQLLSKTEMPIGDIAEAVGFSSPNFMAKVFKEHLKISPKDYRKQHSYEENQSSAM